MTDAAIAGHRSERSRNQLVAGGVVLSALSIAIVLYTAGEEPFFVFRLSDLVLIGVVGTLVCVLFALWAVACVRRLRRAPRRTLSTVVAFVCVLWTAINLFYLGTMVYGYAQDLTNPLFHRAG